ncbi:MAG: hypothetical protein JXQ75_14855 [Phycisphaerae bacterium]|nr:hypothetical protein [Phycisphaerae bacterium]
MASFHSRIGACFGLCVIAILFIGAAPSDGFGAPTVSDGSFPAILASTEPPKKDKTDKPEAGEDEESTADSETSDKEEPRSTQDEDEGASSESAKPADAGASTSEPAEKAEEEDKANTPQVEVYIPSIAALADSGRRSNTAEIYQAIVGMVSLRTDETDDAFDIGALLEVFKQICEWPDTSIAFTVYTQDREGRPRWAVRVNWPLDELRGRLEALLELEATGKILKDVRLNEGDDGSYRLELPDLVLAVFLESDDGTLIASTADLEPPETIFGQEASGDKAASGKSAASSESSGTSKEKKKKKKTSLIYCRLNLAGGDDDDGESRFAMISGVKDVRYGGSLRKDGLWSEKFTIRWNPLIGAFLKAGFKKLKEPFECPRESYAVAAFNTGFGQGIADALAGLPPDTIGSRAGGEMAFAAVPGTGFLPFPDLYYQFKASRKDKIVESIREAIEKDNKERSEEDRPPAWCEEEIDDKPVFWRDPSADRGFSLMPVTYRTVVFFDERGSEEESEQVGLIIAQTPTWADDALHHWKELTKRRKSRITIPDSKKTHWQARINWKRIYDLAQPYLSLVAGLSEEATLPPTADELEHVLADAVINIRIEFGGLKVRHTGPVPVGVVYVPAVAIASLGATADPSSEAARERVACQHLRVLYHHAELFKKDYGRWPATVAELDGYVDFASHPELLRLRPKKKGFTAGLVSMFTGEKEGEADDEDQDDEIDDSLYVIDWSPDDWKLKFRDGEFVNYKTICIDANEKIHRIPKPAETKSTDAESDAPADEEKEKKAA